MKRKKPPTLRSEIASLRRAMLHMAKAHRGSIEAQQINTRKLNAIEARAKPTAVSGAYWICNCRHPNTKVWYAEGL